MATGNSVAYRLDPTFEWKSLRHAMRGVPLSQADDRLFEFWVRWPGPETLREFVVRLTAVE